MRRLLRLAVATAGTLCLSACASAEYSMTPTADAGGSITYDRGVATIASDKTNTAVKVIPAGVSGGFLKFSVAAINHGHDPVNIGVENITVTDVKGTFLHVYTPAEIQKIAKQRAQAAEFALALAGALQTASNSYAATSTSYGNVGGTPYSFSTYNPYYANSLNQQTEAQTAANMQSVNAQLDEAISRIQNTALQTTTVGPGMTFGGNVWVAPPKDLDEAKDPMVVTVTVGIGSDSHTFKFTLNKV
jgi:hypothetical protein